MGFGKSLCPWSPARKRWCWDPVLVSFAQRSPNCDVQSQTPYPRRQRLSPLSGWEWVHWGQREMQEGGTSSLPLWMPGPEDLGSPLSLGESRWEREPTGRRRHLPSPGQPGVVLGGRALVHTCSSPGDALWVASLCSSVGHQRAQRLVQRRSDSQRGRGFQGHTAN